MMQTRPLHRDFGVEVIDVDVMNLTEQGAIDEVRSALDEHQLLLFRCADHVPPDRQVEIASWFGQVPLRLHENITDEKTGENRQWSTLENEKRNGSMRLPFHSDFTFTDSPIKVITLQAIAVPEGGSSTSFVSSLHAWSELSPDRQDFLAGKTARHVREPIEEDEDLPQLVGEYPVRFEHPRTGQPVLLVTEYHTTEILDISRDESNELLAELFAEMYLPERIYVHPWHQYDFLIWDNLAVQHARQEVADISKGPRVLQRAAVNEVSYAELIERARRRQSGAQLQST
jgi:taurine dioxygenase